MDDKQIISGMVHSMACLALLAIGSLCMGFAAALWSFSRFASVGIGLVAVACAVGATCVAAVYVLDLRGRS